MLYAVHIRSQMGAVDETNVDQRAEVLRKRYAVRPQAETDREDTAHCDPNPATITRQRTARPRNLSRLTDLRVRESITRRTARRVSTIVPNPAQQRGDTIAMVRLAWVRCEDAGMAVCAMGRDGILLQGTATATYEDGRRRPPTSRKALGPGGTPTPAVAIGIDGLMYTVRLREGDTPALAARKLAKRLRRRFIVEIEHKGEDCTLVRLVRERLGR